MGLENVAACYLPYGFERQGDGKWVAFNREYFPLFVAGDANLNAAFEKVAERWAKRGDKDTRVRRAKDGKIHTIWLYDFLDGKKDLKAYAEMLALVSFVKVKLPYSPTNHYVQTPPQPGHYSCLKWDRRERVEPPKPRVATASELAAALPSDLSI